MVSYSSEQNFKKEIRFTPSFGSKEQRQSSEIT